MSADNGVWYRRLGRLAAGIELALLTLILGSMVLLSFSQVLLRLFRSPLSLEIDPLLRNLVLWAALAGAIVATRQGKNITIDVVTHVLPPRARSAVRACTNLFSSIICGLLAAATWGTVKMERAFASVTFADVPVWIAELIMPVGFAIIAAHFLVRAVSDARQAIRRGAS